MSWQEYHRREAALHDVMQEADRRRDGELPWELGSARAAFQSPADLLLALHLHWHTRLSGEVERELAAEPLELDSAVARAWREAAASLPGTRAVLDAYDDDPALRAAQRKELAYLASAAGLAELADPAAPVVGARVRDAARASASQPSDDGRPSGWLERLLHALVA